MRLTEMMKPKPQTINTDGKQYQFTPGQGGSLVTTPQATPPTPSFPVQTQPKPPQDKAKAIVGSVRG